MKVFEFAKEIGVETLVLMDKIREWKLPVKSHMATLDDELMTAIRQRLGEEEEAKKPKKKATVKKAGAAKTAKTTKTAKKEKPAKAVKPVTAAKADGEKEVKKTTAKKSTVKKPKTGVIRRKAGEPVEPLHTQAAPAAEMTEAPTAVDAESVLADATAVADGAQTATPGEQTVEAKKRTNIIGRMDLSRATRPPGSFGVGDPRVARPTALGGRNIRAGFVAPSIPTPEDFAFQEKAREEKERKRKAGAGREEEVQQFNAADFRKREVIFQPKKKRLVVARDGKKTQITTPKASKRVIRVDRTLKVGELAQAMGVKAPVIMKKLVAGGIMANINTDLDFDTISLIASEFDFEAQNVYRTAEELVDEAAFGELQSEPVTRPPVVTVMGHVDHGKTSLLDAIRSADVAGKEAGGITQHIGAYKVSVPGDKFVTFLDTPGHEAFTAMRARGANVTDIAIIVVAADDGVMPQTAEAISHAKAAEVPIIIAINKIDKPSANIDRIKQQLTEYEIVPEEWGGTNIFVPVSALKKTGIDELLEQILLVSEVEDLKANPKRSGTGIVIEARLEKGRGPVATILVQDGTVRTGETIVCGRVVGRVRAMMNDRGEQTKEALPGDPVEILGLENTPAAGDRFDVVKDDETARKVAEVRIAEVNKPKATGKDAVTLEELFAKVQKGDMRELNVVLKADVAGSVEAVKAMLEKASTPEVKVKILHASVGGISESDVLLAATSGGIILGFNVRPDNVALRSAKERNVEVKTYSIIYELLDDVKKAMSGLLKPVTKEVVQGRAEVREVFSVPKIGNIAGCAVTDGKITRSSQCRLIREGKIVYEGKFASLKRFKDDVREVAQGYECGIGIENFNDIKVGDIIESYIIEETRKEIT